MRNGTTEAILVMEKQIKHLWEAGDVETLNQGTGVVSADDLDTAAEIAFEKTEAAIEAVERKGRNYEQCKM